MENASILNYEGNAALAAGSANGESVEKLGVLDFAPTIASLQGLHKRINDVADTNYRQKIADRDKVFNMVATLKTDLDKVLPEHREALRKKRDEVERLLLTNPDILADREAYTDAMKHLDDFNELNAYAKSAYVSATTDLLEASKIEDPDDQKKMLDHVSSQRNKLKANPYELYDPYKHDLTMNFAEMFPGSVAANGPTQGFTTTKNVSTTTQTAGKPSTTRQTSTSSTAPAATATTTKAGKTATPTIPTIKKVIKQGGDDFIDTYQETTDVNKLLDYYRLNVVEGQNKSLKNMYDKFFDGMALKTPEERAADFDRWNAKIDLANKHLDAGTAPVKKITYDEQTGIPTADISKDDFNRAALIGNSYNEGAIVSAYNKDRAEAYKTKALADAATLKAKTDALYKGALGQAARTKAGAYAAKLRAQVKKLDKDEDKDALLDELYKSNLLNQSNLLQSRGGDKFSVATIKAQNSLPMFTFDGKTVKLLAPIGGKPIKDKSQKIIGYEGGWYEPVYMLNGKDVSSDLGKMYGNFKRIAAQKGQEWHGDMTDWIKESVKNDALEFLMKGANGTTDRKLSLAAQRAISNQNTKKGQDEVFEPIDGNVVDDPGDE